MNLDFNIKIMNQKQEVTYILIIILGILLLYQFGIDLLYFLSLIIYHIIFAIPESLVFWVFIILVSGFIGVIVFFYLTEENLKTLEECQLEQSRMSKDVKHSFFLNKLDEKPEENFQTSQKRSYQKEPSKIQPGSNKLSNLW